MLHDQLNVLVLETICINCLFILLFVLLVVVVVMIMVMIVTLSFAVVVASVGIDLSAGELLSCGSLSLGVEVFNLSLAEDAVWVN